MANTPGRIRAQAIFDSSLRLVDDQSNSLTRSARLTMPRAGRVTMPLTVTSRSEPDRRKSTQSGCSKESYPATGTGVWSNRARIAAATAQNLCAATLKTADELVTAQSAGTSPTRFVTAGRRCEGRPFTSLWPTASPRARAGSAPFQWCPQRA
jgi:hypothetical protein